MTSHLRFVAFGMLSIGCVLAQDRFSERLTTEERAAAGLYQLTPAQLATLDALVKKDHDRAATLPTAAATAPTATAPETPVANTTPAETASPRPDAPAKRRHFGLPVRDETNAIAGVLDGEFNGWHGATVFRLQDGQVWVQEDKTDVYDATPRANPKVNISKSMFGGYKLSVEGVPGWVRVRRIQ